MAAIDWVKFNFPELSDDMRRVFERLLDLWPRIDWLKLPFMAREPQAKGTLDHWNAIINEARAYLDSFAASASNFNPGMQTYLNENFPQIFPLPGNKYHQKSGVALDLVMQKAARTMVDALRADLGKISAYIGGIPMEKTVIEMPDPILPISQLLDVPVVNPETGETALVETGVHLGLTNKNIAQGGDPNFDQQGAVQGALNAVAAALPPGWKLMPKEQGGINVAAFNAPGGMKMGVMGWALVIGGGLVVLRLVAGGSGRKR